MSLLTDDPMAVAILVSRWSWVPPSESEVEQLITRFEHGGDASEPEMQAVRLIKSRVLTRQRQAWLRHKDSRPAAARFVTAWNARMGVTFFAIAGTLLTTGAALSESFPWISVVLALGGGLFVLIGEQAVRSDIHTVRIDVDEQPTAERLDPSDFVYTPDIRRES